MPISGDVQQIIKSLLGYTTIIFTLLSLMTSYASYEFHRRMQLFSHTRHPETRRLFNQLRYLFLFITLHLVATAIHPTLPKSFYTCLLVAVLHITAYIGIGSTAISVAFGRILILGRNRDNDDSESGSDSIIAQYKKYFPLKMQGR